MATTTEMLTAIKKMNVMDLIDLVKTLEEEFGVTNAPPIVPVLIQIIDGPMGGPSVEEQTEFAVWIKEVGSMKINVIKAVREVTSLGLREAKGLVESHHPVIKEGIPRDGAESIKKKLEEAGATAEVS